MQSYACSLCLEPGRHTDVIWSVRLSPDETKLLTQSGDGTAKVWDAQTGELLLTVPVYGAASNLCCFSPCGGLVVSSSADGKELTLLRASDGSTVASAPAAFDGDNVYSATFSPDSVRLAVGSEQGGVRLFSVPELNLLSTLPREGDEDGVHSAVFTGDGRALIIAAGCALELWDVAPGGEPKLRHTLRADWACHGSVSPDGKHAVAGGWSGEPTDVWELQSDARVLQLPAESDGSTVFSSCWLPSGDVIATCSGAGVVRFWSFSSDDLGDLGQLLGSVDVFGGRLRSGMEIRDFCLSPSGGVFACVGGDSTQKLPFVKVFRAPTLTLLQQQLGELLRSRRGADVTLACAGSGGGSGGGGAVETKAHSLILALRSGTLQRQLDWGAEREGGAAAAAGAGGASGTSRLEIDGSVEPAILERLLEYMYTDHLVIQSAEEAQHLLHAAAFYDVPGLFQLCLPALERLLAVENVVETLIAADKFGAPAAGLKLAALRFVKDNAKAAMASQGWEQRLSKRLTDEAMYFLVTGEELPPQQQVAAGADGTGAVADDGPEHAAAAGTGGTGEASAVGAGRNVRQRTA